MDISSQLGYPAGDLSNFTARSFVFHEWPCASLEGLLQALKFEDEEEQAEVCLLVGKEAKKRGSKRNSVWQENQVVWFRGTPYDRHGLTFQIILDGFYRCVFEQDETFRQALIATGTEKLTHSIGKSDPHKTILTEDEFCGRLMQLRHQYL